MTEEFAVWEQRAKGALKAHNSQITSTILTLRAAVDGVAARVETAVPETEAGAIDRTILDLHLIWEFFRSKFVLREDSLFRPFLHAADQLAYECWYRAVDGAVTRGAQTRKRAPPLVFFSDQQTPFVLPRDRPYEVKMAPNAPITSEQLTGILKSLPVPVIGVPWSVVKHLPDALAIAHEVGHVIEDDLALADEIGRAIDAAVPDPQRLEAWKEWGSELFADAFAITAVGPAFLGVLADTLAADPGVVVLERRATACWTRYPTAWLRMAYAAAVLDILEFTKQENATWASWKASYTAHAMTEFDQDIARVAGAIAGTRYTGLGGATLKEVVGIDPVMPDFVSGSLLRDLYPLPSDDARAIAAGARIAFEKDPGTYARGHARAIQHLEAYWNARGSLRSAGTTVPAGGDLLAALTPHWQQASSR